MTSPKDSIFCDGGEQDYDARIDYDLDNGTATTVPVTLAYFRSAGSGNVTLRVGDGHRDRQPWIPPLRSRRRRSAPSQRDADPVSDRRRTDAATLLTGCVGRRRRSLRARGRRSLWSDALSRSRSSLARRMAARSGTSTHRLGRDPPRARSQERWRDGRVRARSRQGSSSAGLRPGSRRGGTTAACARTASTE